MKKIIITLLIALSFFGCSSKGEEALNVTPNLVVGKNLNSLNLSDQFEKKHSLNATTNKVVFAFSKDVAHTCNDFFATKDADYLSTNNTQFIADVSAAPSLIRSMFIMPGLKDFKHTVLILDDEAKAAPFRSGVDVEKIVVVYLTNGTITNIKTLTSEKELQTTIEEK